MRNYFLFSFSILLFFGPFISNSLAEDRLFIQEKVIKKFDTKDYETLKKRLEELKLKMPSADLQIVGGNGEFMRIMSPEEESFWKRKYIENGVKKFFKKKDELVCTPSPPNAVVCNGEVYKKDGREVSGQSVKRILDHVASPNSQPDETSANKAQ